MLRFASIIFHIGVLMAIGGHVMGLLIPVSWTDAVGVTDHMYHVVAVFGGVTAGIAVIVGFALLVYRRLKFPRVRVTTTRMDVAVFALLAFGIVTGMLATIDQHSATRFRTGRRSPRTSASCSSLTPIHR